MNTIRSSVFFAADAADDLTYRNIRESTGPRAQEIRAHCESLWERFAPYADHHFLTEVPRRFHARYWEMYLAVTIMDCGYEIVAPKPGPDFGITVDGHRMWIEAVTTTAGAEENPEQVPGFVFGQMQQVPNEQMVLRYVSAISEKVLRQRPRWIEGGHVNANDCLIVALNPKLIDHEVFDTIPPRIVQVAYPVGPLAVVVDPRTGRHVETRAQARTSIRRVSGAAVGTGVFFDERYAALTGLICSRVDVGNRPEILGADFQFLPNPCAIALTPDALRLRGTVYRPRHSEGSIELQAIDWQSNEPIEQEGDRSKPLWFKAILSDPEWMADPERKARDEAARAIDEILGRTKPSDGKR